MTQVLPGRNEVQKRRGGDYRVFIFPICCVQVYLTFTVLLFAFGPWPWPVLSPIKLYLFLAFAQLALLAGYLSARNAPAIAYSGKITWKRLFVISLILNAIWVIPNFMMRSGVVSLNLTELLSNINIGLTDPGTAYKAKVEAMGSSHVGLLIIGISLCLGPLLSLMFPLGLVYWRKLRNSLRILFVILIVLDGLTWVASGTNKGLADLAFLLPFLILAGKPDVIRRMRWQTVGRNLVLVIVLGIGIFTFFASGQVGRAGGMANNIIYDNDAGIFADENHILLRNLPELERFGVTALCSYITQGYYGLSLSLETPFVWTYGLGNAYYTASWAEKYTGIDIASLTYPARSDRKYGWSDFARWHTIYPWLASDLTFPGTLVFMFVIGRLFALAWRDIIQIKHPLAIGVFSLMLIMLFYIPANNQILGFPQSACSFLILLCWWLRTRTRCVQGRAFACTIKVGEV